jgi:hypothetical protein
VPPPLVASLVCGRRSPYSDVGTCTVLLYIYMYGTILCDWLGHPSYNVQCNLIYLLSLSPPELDGVKENNDHSLK